MPSSGAGGGARLVDLIHRLQFLAITSSSEHIRAEARCCLVLFLLNYPHKAKFVQSFVAFCLRQLEYKKAFGRSSALSLLTGLTADLPISRLTANNLEETILVSVGAAIERESVRALRVSMLALIRLLFTRLPPALAEAHFRDYLLAFVTAPAATRTSARLLGLQLVSAVLDCQPCLALSKLRPTLLKLMGTNVLPTAAQQLHQVILTNPTVRQLSGLAPLFSDPKLCPMEEIARAQAVMEDAEWVAELHPDSEIRDSVSEGDAVSEDDDIDSIKSQTDNEQGDFVKEDTDEVDDADDSDAEPDREKMHFEEAEEQARGQCESYVPASETEQTCSRSALEKHYLIVAHTTEYALRLLQRLMEGGTEDDTKSLPTNGDSRDTYVVSDLMTSAWSVLTGITELPSNLNSKEGEITQKRSSKRQRYARLLCTVDSKPDQSDRMSLCCAGYRGAREWATRCLAPLLRVESAANAALLSGENVEHSESVPGAGLTKSAFFNQLRKKRKTRIAMLELLTRDTIFQLDHDAKQPLNEQWSDSLVANLVHLGQLLHLSAGRRPVLRLFRSINRIALDELNNRPKCYFQRTLVLKITTGLLLRLPRPKTTTLLELLTADHSTLQLEPTESGAEKPRCIAYLSYLRAASRVIAREFRQRERLAFMAAATITGTVDDGDNDQPALARARLGGVKLSKEQSVRARARRRKAQARLRRALMSGTMRPEMAQDLVALTAASRAQAGPDQLVNVIEAAESTLEQEFGENGATVIKLVCSQATRTAKARQQARTVTKATKEALGAAWSGKAKKRIAENNSVPKTKRARIEKKHTDAACHNCSYAPLFISLTVSGGHVSKLVGKIPDLRFLVHA
ncbi:unnamed protein product [Echinostoma caproni]|uniref:CBF domain-containing protein n=1 Tax=Echinostoma caproni TaxID=27848 RepID=A0A183ARF9_9TREM|nr:unnamed protein product [Echinostoma caproni]